MFGKYRSRPAPPPSAPPVIDAAPPPADAPEMAAEDDDGLPESVRRCLAHKSTLKVVHPQVNVESFVERCRARGIDFWLTVDMVDDMYTAHCRMKTVNLAPLNPGRMREILLTLPGVTRVRERPNRPEHQHLVDEIGLDPKEKSIMFRIAGRESGHSTAKTGAGPRRDPQPPAERVGKPGQEWSRSGLELVADRSIGKKQQKPPGNGGLEVAERVRRVA